MVVEAWAGDTGLAFDGRVVEVFFPLENRRYHVRLVRVRVTGPNRKGNRMVGVGTERNSHTVEVEPADWPAFEHVLQAIAAAQA